MGDIADILSSLPPSSRHVTWWLLDSCCCTYAGVLVLDCVLCCPQCLIYLTRRYRTFSPVMEVNILPLLTAALFAVAGRERRGRAVAAVRSSG